MTGYARLVGIQANLGIWELVEGDYSRVKKTAVADIESIFLICPICEEAKSTSPLAAYTGRFLEEPNR